MRKLLEAQLNEKQTILSNLKQELENLKLEQVDNHLKGIDDSLTMEKIKTNRKETTAVKKTISEIKKQMKSSGKKQQNKIPKATNRTQIINEIIPNNIVDQIDYGVVSQSPLNIFSNQKPSALGLGPQYNQKPQNNKVKITKEDPVKSILGDFSKWMKDWFGTDFLKYFGDAIKRGFDTVKGHFNDILGDLKSDIIDPIFDITKSTFQGFVAMFGMDSKRRSKMWKKIFEMMTTKGIRDKLDSMKKKKQITNFGILLFAVGAIIGSVVGLLAAPFRFLGWLARQVPFIEKGVNLFVTLFSGKAMLIGKLKFLNPVFKILGKVGGIFSKIFRFLGKSRLLTMFGEGFLAGFRKIFWPLQIIISVMDFMDGFNKDPRLSLGKRIISGLKNVVLKFLEMPVRLLGWLFERVAGFFGVEIHGTGDKLMDWLGKAFDMWIGYIKFMWKWTVEKPLELFKFIATYVQDKFKDFGGDKLIEGAKQFFSNIIDYVKNIFTGLWDAIKNKGVVGSIMGIFGGEKKETPSAKLGGFVKAPGLVNVHDGEIISPIEKVIDSPAKIIQKTTMEINQKKNEIEREKITTSKNLENVIKESNIKVADVMSKKTGELGNTINANLVQQTQTGNNVGDTIPDEIENFTILLMNKSWGMG